MLESTESYTVKGNRRGLLSGETGAVAERESRAPHANCKALLSPLLFKLILGIVILVPLGH